MIKEDEFEKNISILLSEASNEKQQVPLYSEPDYLFRNETRFVDNIWDFSDQDKNHNNKSLYIFDFSSIESISIRILFKKTILRDIYSSNNIVKAAKSNLYAIVIKFIQYLEEEKYIFEIEQITPRILTEYINEKYKELSVRTISFYLGALKKFLQEAQHNNYGIKLKDFRQIFNSIDNYQIKAQIQANKTPTIPKLLLERIRKFASKDIGDEKLNISQRIAACMILILSHTGMRKGELFLLEADRLREETIFNKTKVPYLEFFTYKTAILGGRWTVTFAREEMVSAYNTWEFLTKEARNKHSSQYLYINEKTGKRMTDNALKRYLRVFFYRHQKKLGFNSLSKHQKLQIQCEKLTKLECRYSKYYKEKDIGKSFWYVNPHQFRVALANELKDRVGLQWIRYHMNHLEEEMTKHYFRDDDLIKNTLFERTTPDGERLETNPQSGFLKEELAEPELKQAYQTINKFLEKKKLKIFKDIEEILFLLKNNPLRETSVGLCTKAMGMLCERQERLEMFERWHYFSSPVTNVSAFDFTYKRFIDKAKVVKHNKTLVEKDQKYERQYILEYQSLKTFYSNCVSLELGMLQEKMKSSEEADLISLYPNLKEIVSKLEVIEREIEQWKVELEL